MSIEAVVALKALSQSKRRLSAVLNDEQRSDLVEAMAQDVLSCLMRHPEIDAVHVVCGEGWMRDVFPEGPLVVWQESESHEHGLIAAHEMVAVRTGAERLLFIHADLPFLGQEDISAVIAASVDHHAVFSPDFTETGTNAVLRWRDQSVPLCFGEDSFARHQQAAKAAETRGGSCVPAVWRGMSTSQRIWIGWTPMTPSLGPPPHAGRRRLRPVYQ